MNPDGLALVVSGRVVNSRLAESRPAILGDDHTQVFRVTMSSLGVEEDLPRASATLRPLDEHFHRDRLVDPAYGFDGRQVHVKLLHGLGLRLFVNFQIKYSELEHQAAPEMAHGIQ